MIECTCTGDTDTCLQNYLAEYRKYYDESLSDIDALRTVIAHLEAPLKQLESKIKAAVVEDGKSVKGHGITVTFRKGYIRHKWDNKGLQGYAVANPQVMAFHSETDVGPSVSVKVE